jgi:hypothetical protein
MTIFRFKENGTLISVDAIISITKPCIVGNTFECAILFALQEDVQSFILAQVSRLRTSTLAIYKRKDEELTRKGMVEYNRLVKAWKACKL